MSKNEIKLSTLRCEPYLADISECKDDYYGPPDLILWRIFVGAECVAKRALPFLAMDEFLEFVADNCVPYFGDGRDYVAVRLFEDKVLWFGFYPRLPFSYNYVPLPIEGIYVFNATQYIQAIDESKNFLVRPKHTKAAEPTFLKKFLDYVFGSVSSVTKIKPVHALTTPLPTLSSQELKATLLNVIPYDFSLPLYRMPELADDRRGERLYRAVCDAISLHEIRISEPPPNPIEVRIGLDKDVFVESVWQLGKLGDEVAILFVTEPHFPLWLSGFKSILPLVSEALNAGE